MHKLLTKRSNIPLWKKYGIIDSFNSDNGTKVTKLLKNSMFQQQHWLQFRKIKTKHFLDFSYQKICWTESGNLNQRTLFGRLWHLSKKHLNNDLLLFAITMVCLSWRFSLVPWSNVPEQFYCTMIDCHIGHALTLWCLAAFRDFLKKNPPKRTWLCAGISPLLFELRS